MEDVLDSWDLYLLLNFYLSLSFLILVIIRFQGVRPKQAPFVTGDHAVLPPRIRHIHTAMWEKNGLFPPLQWRHLVIFLVLRHFGNLPLSPWFLLLLLPPADQLFSL